MKTNRQTILEALAKNPRSTIDELITATDWPRKKVHDTVASMTKDGFLTRERDDVTGLPCHRLTKKGQAAIVVAQEHVVEQPAPIEAAEKPCCTSAKVVATTAGAEIAELKNEITRREHELITQTGLVVELRKRIAELETAVDTAQQTIHDMELEATQAAPVEAIDVKDAAVGYLVRTSKKPPRLFTNPEKARATAIFVARQGGRADVLALVPVGTAVRSAEWQEAA